MPTQPSKTKRNPRQKPIPQAEDQVAKMPDFVSENQELDRDQALLDNLSALPQISERLSQIDQSLKVIAGLIAQVTIKPTTPSQPSQPNNPFGEPDYTWQIEANHFAENWYDPAIPVGSLPLKEVFGVNIVAQEQQNPLVRKILQELKPRYVRIYDHIAKHDFSKLGGVCNGYNNRDTELHHSIREVLDCFEGIQRPKVIVAIEDWGGLYPPAIGQTMGYPNKFTPESLWDDRLGKPGQKVTPMEFAHRIFDQLDPIVGCGDIDFIHFNELRGQVHPGLANARQLVAAMMSYSGKAINKNHFLSPCFDNKIMIGDSIDRSYNSNIDYFDAYVAGVEQSIFGVAMNAYTIDSSNPNHLGSIRDQVNSIQQLPWKTPTNKAILTETGYPATDVESETRQAKYILLDFFVNAALGIPYLYYGMIDADYLSGVYSTFGLKYKDGKPKLAYSYLQQLLSQHGDQQVVKIRYYQQKDRYEVELTDKTKLAF